jgi:flavin-dependent dehydrogenase
MYDLIIIDDDPSRASAERVAVKLGLNTLLLEKEEFPRYKPCDGKLSEHSISNLDFDLPPKIIEREITGAKLFFKEQFIKAKEKHRLSVLISRNGFDTFLLEKAKKLELESIQRRKFFAARKWSLILK